MKKILISGCCGFIGSNFAKFLIDKNYIIYGIDNLITGNIDNIKELNNNNNFNFIKHDICNEIKINSDFDYVIHLASPASPADFEKYPIEIMRTGSLGTENILNFTYKKNAVVLVASTSEVYGDSQVSPQNENYFGNVNPIGIRSVYDESKRFTEALTMAFHRKKKLKCRIARIFNTYGPLMKVDDGRVIPNLINQALENKNLTLYGNGNQTRSFCYIKDTIEGLYKLLNSNYTKPVNIGNNNEITINQLAQLIKKLIGSENKIVYKKLPEDDPKIRKPDIELANKILNWYPKIELTDGLKTTIDYFRKKQIKK